MESLLVTGLFTLLGAILGISGGAFLQHRKETKGYYLRGRRKTRKYSGKAFDVAIVDPQMPAGCSIESDFQRNSDTIWTLDYDFSFDGQLLGVAGTASDGTRDYKVIGSGNFIGSDQTGHGSVTVKGIGGDEEGWVFYVLRWSNPGAITGYWIAKDRDKFADFAFGGITLQRHLSDSKTVSSGF